MTAGMVPTGSSMIPDAAHTVHIVTVGRPNGVYGLGRGFSFGKAGREETLEDALTQIN